MGEPKTVLIVEDEKNIVDILKFNLQRAGYQTLEAYDGEDGLAQALSANPDLILLDVMLPKKNGFDVCRALRQSGSNVPVIILTSRDTEAGDVPRQEYDRHRECAEHAGGHRRSQIPPERPPDVDASRDVESQEEHAQGAEHPSDLLRPDATDVRQTHDAQGDAANGDGYPGQRLLHEPLDGSHPIKPSSALVT